MKFTLYTADCSGNPKNKAYPHEMIVTSAADLKKAVRFDHVCARYAGNVRSEANFEMSDVLVLDCDNTHSDDPEEWIDAESLSAILTDVAYAIVYSRSHMIPKNGKTARPKMHVYLPAGICKDATMHKKMKCRSSTATLLTQLASSSAVREKSSGMRDRSPSRTGFFS